MEWISAVRWSPEHPIATESMVAGRKIKGSLGNLSLPMFFFFGCRKGRLGTRGTAFERLSDYLCHCRWQHSAAGGNSGNENLWHSFLKKSALQKCRNSEKGHMGHDWSFDWHKASRLKAVREEYVGMFWVVSIWLKLWRKGELGLRYQKLTKIWSGLSAIFCQFATFCLQLWVQVSLAFEVPGSFFFLWGSVGCLALCTTHWKTLRQKRGNEHLGRMGTEGADSQCYVLCATGHWRPVTCDRKLGRRFIALDPKQWT